jgi:hypothetical protein
MLRPGATATPALPPCPAGVKVWGFSPPGGMVTANLSHALEGFVTSIAVGKDAISRTGSVTFERLLDQVGCRLRVGEAWHAPDATLARQRRGTACLICSFYTP